MYITIQDNIIILTHLFVTLISGNNIKYYLMVCGEVHINIPSLGS